MGCTDQEDKKTNRKKLKSQNRGSKCRGDEENVRKGAVPDFGIEQIKNFSSAPIWCPTTTLSTDSTTD